MSRKTTPPFLIIRTIIAVAMVMFMATDVNAQESISFQCTEDMRKNAKAGVDEILKQQRISELGARASLPYTIRIQVVVFYKTTATVTDEDIHRNINNMANFFRPHNICFILSDIEYVQNTAMADFHKNNEADLLPYTRPSYLTLFIHTNLNSSQGLLDGTAYAIPNNYLSMVDDIMLSTTQLSILSHEMGHCFGLYHTFETSLGQENRARSGPCRNCETTGDLLCDTEADKNISATDISTSCIYTGTLTDNCDNMQYVMETRNIMAYGRRTCTDRFTNGQGARARDHILTDAKLFSCIAPDVVTVTFNANYTGGVYSLTAKEWINVTSSSYNISGNAQMRMTSRSIRIGPGSAFRPTGTNAIVALKPNDYCQ